MPQPPFDLLRAGAEAVEHVATIGELISLGLGRAAYHRCVQAQVPHLAARLKARRARTRLLPPFAGSE